MNTFRKKQRRFKLIMNCTIIVSAIYIVLFIGAEPYIKSALGSSSAFNYLAQGLIILSLILIFVYYTRYSKSDRYLENAEYIISDAGYYYSSRNDADKESCLSSVNADLLSFGYKIEEKITVNELSFDTVASKQKEQFYIVKLDSTDKNDIIAYLDSAVYDLTAVRLKRKGTAVLLFITDYAADDAISLSKDITELGRKAQLKLAVCICTVPDKRVYFLGNKISKHQQMIANFVMNCDLPIKDEYISKDKLPFQKELEEKLSNFSLKDFKDGKYTER